MLVDQISFDYLLGGWTQKQEVRKSSVSGRTVLLTVILPERCIMRPA